MDGRFYALIVRANAANELLLIYFYLTELPLEPSLARTLIEANKNDCLPKALTVAAMLSVEETLHPRRSKHTYKKRKQPPSEVPDGTMDAFCKKCKETVVQIMQKFAKGSLDVRRKERRRDRQNDYQNLRKSLCVGYASQLAERMIRHNGYRTVGFKSQLVQVHPSSVMRTDDEGVFPNYVVYHELISTSHPYMRNVCELILRNVLTALEEKLKEVAVEQDEMKKYMRLMMKEIQRLSKLVPDKSG
nr:probable pre-mRNA-splicing factor ATP-dependent RNA helicase DEAH4 isoform X2 [Tanacetum cinerariifolium]